MTDEPHYEDYWIPAQTTNAALNVAAEATEQFIVGYISIKGDAAGTATLTIGATIVWRGRFPAGGSDGQFFGIGIKNADSVNEAIVVAVVGPANYETCIGYKRRRQRTP